MDDKLDNQLPAVSDVGQQGFVDRVSAIAPKGWRLRLAKAAAQLIAGSEKGAAAYGEIRERIDTIEGRSTVSNALADAVARQAIQDPDVMERAKARFLGDMSRKQANLEAVIEGAGQQMLQLPPPAAVYEIQPGHDENLAAGDEIPPTSDAPLNPDWAITFSGLAENASSDELRTRLSKVLAGEILAPGTYSRATIRQIAELERSDLQAMQAVLPYVFLDQIFKTKDDPQMPSYDMMRQLAESGMLTDTNSLLSKNWKTAVEDGVNYGLVGRQWGIVIIMRTGQSISLPIGQLTRTGNAVVDLLGRPDERDILKRIASDIPENVYKRILLGRAAGELSIDQPVTQILPLLGDNNISTNIGASPFSSVMHQDTNRAGDDR